MKILAIESAGTVASIALIEEGVIVCDYTVNGKYTHSKTIMPMIESMEKITDTDLSTIDAVAVSGGPGSYTGLRIGSATAKGLAHVWNVPIISVSTIESMANNFEQTERIICPMLDARRQHAFCGAYKYEGNQLVNVVPIDLRSVEEFSKELIALKGQCVFLGDGYLSHKKLVETYMPEGMWEVARADLMLPRASILAKVAADKFAKGSVETYMDHQPDYYRVSQAERELKKNDH